MSGVSLSNTHKAAEAQVDSDGKIRYTVYYHVEMSSAGDGPQQVLVYLESHGIMWGISYDFANDSDIGTFCDGITVRRIANSTTRWEATVTYGPPTKKQDDDGNPSDAPEDWRWDIDCGYACWQEPVWRAFNITAFPHPLQMGFGSFVRAANTLGPVVNSANVVLDPPLMKDVYDWVMRITTYSLWYSTDVASAYMGTINNAKCQLSPYMQAVHRMYPREFDTHTLKCCDAGAKARVYTLKQSGAQIRIPYWEWNWEFRERPSGWNEEVLDRGITALPKVDMPAGEHERSDNYPDELEPGDGAHMPVLDSNERRVPELVLFDGKGYPLRPVDPRWQSGYYFEWLKDYALAFAYPNIPFNFFSEVT